MLAVLRTSSLVLVGLLALPLATAQDVVSEGDILAPSTERAQALTIPARTSGALNASSEHITLGDNVRRPADLYTFTLVPRQSVTVRIESSAFASQMDVFQDGRHISDDLNFDVSDGVEMVTLSGPGEYLLVASTYDEDAAGAYELTVSASPTAQGSSRTPPEPRTDSPRSDTEEASAPPAGAAPGGQTLDGTLSDDDSDIVLFQGDGTHKVDAYSLPLRVGDVVVVTMESSAFDTYLALSLSSTVVAYNDDAGSTARSRIRHTVSEDGEYVILASTYAETGRGPYSLSWVVERGRTETADNAPPAPASTPLTIPARVTGELTDTSERVNYTPAERYTLSLQRGQSVTVRMESTAFNTYLRVFRDGEPVAENDDYDGSRTVSQVLLSSPGDYTIFATAYSMRGRGPYELTVSDATLRPVGTRISVPEPTTGESDASHRTRFPFEITESTASYPVGLSGAAFRAAVFTLTLAPGDRVTVRVAMEADGAIPPSPTVYFSPASQPHVVTFRRPQPGERFVEFVLDTPDTYTLYVGDAYSRTSIRGALVLEAAGSAENAPSTNGFEQAPPPITLAIPRQAPRRVRHSGEITEDAPAYPIDSRDYTFTAQAFTVTVEPGDQVSVRVTLDSDDFTMRLLPTVFFYTSSRRWPLEMRTVPRLNEPVEFTLDQPGTYTLYVGNGNGDHPYQYTLELEASPARSASGSRGFGPYWADLSDADEEVTLTEEGGVRRADAYTVELRAGDTLVVDMISSDVDTYLKLTRGSTTIAYNDDSGQGSNSEIRYTAQVSGTYTIYAGAYGDNERGGYSISARVE